MSSAAFLSFWRTDLTRDCFLSYTAQEDLRSLRLVCRDTAGPVTPYLFADIQVNFNANTFLRQARMTALEQIGNHIKTFTFCMPHKSDTFLPPLLDSTGIEQTYHYAPTLNTSRPSSASSHSSEPKYGSWEMNDLLVKQYPPNFHAATNVASFIRAFTAMPSLRHVRISCSGQSSNQRYRRSVVDYALISLRMALERACPPSLTALSLQDIHPSALLHLRPTISAGTSPVSTKLWRRISNLTIEMDTLPFDTDQPSDHLKILHSYLQSFPALSKLTFRWLGSTKGPSPLSLNLEPCIVYPSIRLDDCCSLKPRSEPSTKPSLRPLRLRKLKFMHLENATMDASQASDFIMRHRKTLHEFEFSQCTLRSGTWEEALEPLVSRCETGKRSRNQEREVEVMDVPLMLSVEELRREPVQKEEFVRDAMWNDDEKRRWGTHALKKAGLRTKEILGSEGLRKMLRYSSALKWR